MSSNTSRLPLPPTSQPQSPNSAAQPIKYTFYHPEASGFFHVRYVGSGVQGTVTLVRAVHTGQLFVRKRRHYQNDRGDVDSEAELSRLVAHPNVVKCLGQCKYTDPNSKQVSTASYWPYANCRDLAKLIRMFDSADRRVPEMLVWRYLCQILGAIHQAHVQGIQHGDGHSANILVNWRSTDLLPDFFIGDWGLAQRFDDVESEVAEVGLTGGPGVPGGPRMPGLAERVVPFPHHVLPNPVNHPKAATATASASATTVSGTTPTNNDTALPPLPTLDSLFNYDASDSTYHVQKDAGHSPSFIDLISEDLILIVDNAVSMMYGNASRVDGGGNDFFYTVQLRGVVTLLVRFDDYLHSDHVQTFARYRHIFGLVYAYLREQEAKTWVEYVAAPSWSALRQVVHPDAHALPSLVSPAALPSTEDVARSDCCKSESTHPTAHTHHHLHHRKEEEEEEKDKDQQTCPPLYNTRQELEACGFRPPGPWQLAMLDGVTGQIIHIDTEVRDLEVTICTNGVGGSYVDENTMMMDGCYTDLSHAEESWSEDWDEEILGGEEEEEEEEEE